MSRGLKASSINPIVGALRFFYGTTLGNKQLAEQIPFGRVADTLPAVLTREQVLQLIKAERSLKMRTIFITIYAAGLRVSEAVGRADVRSWGMSGPKIQRDLGLLAVDQSRQVMSSRPRATLADARQ